MEPGNMTPRLAKGSYRKASWTRQKRLIMQVLKKLARAWKLWIPLLMLGGLTGCVGYYQEPAGYGYDGYYSPYYYSYYGPGYYDYYGPRFYGYYGGHYRHDFPHHREFRHGGFEAYRAPGASHGAYHGRGGWHTTSGFHAARDARHG